MAHVSILLYYTALTTMHTSTSRSRLKALQTSRLGFVPVSGGWRLSLVSVLAIYISCSSLEWSDTKFWSETKVSKPTTTA